MTRELFLYSRNDCHLCEQMKRALQPRLRAADAVLRVVDIAGDTELEHRYGARIPVLVAGNRELCEGRLDKLALDAYLG